MHQDSTWPADPECYVTARQVAAKLGYGSVKTFYNARHRELAAKNFPAPSIGRRWKASVIERWEAMNDHAALTGQHPAAPANDTHPAPTSPRQRPVSQPAYNPARERLAAIQRAANLS